MKTRPNVLAYNPVCQRLFDSGDQCNKPSTVVHHLVDPKDAPDKAHDRANLVAVCAEHHPGGQRGETMGYRYCATIANHVIHYHPGGQLPTWHPKFHKPSPGSISLLAGTSTSAVGAAAIDRALAGWDPKLLEGL
jgi:hypothetical protein